MLQQQRKRQELDGSSRARIYFLHLFHATAKLGWNACMVISRPDLKAMNLHLHHPGFSLHRVGEMKFLLTVKCFPFLARSTEV
jgi:hypothetical protein